MKLLFGFALIITLRSQTVWFEPNQGQIKGQTEWVAHSGSVSMYITGAEVVYALPPRIPSERPQPPVYTHNIRAKFVGALPKTHAEAVEPLGSYSNYFLGRTAKDWFTGIPHYAKVRYRNLYHGIDVVYYVNGRNMEYDFNVAPGADLNQIQLAFSETPRIEKGDLIVAGLRQRRPQVYQDGREIACDYIVRDGKVQLALAEYDHSKGLTIDPVLEFSTYLGGVAEEHGFAIALDSAGYVYLAGGSQSPATPTLNPFQQTSALVLSPVVFKFSPDGQRLVYFAFIGNKSWDNANAIAVDSDGSPILFGRTRNPNFPLKNAFQSSFLAIGDTAFVSKLTPDGKSLVYSSYLGGSNRELGNGIAIDAQGNAFMTGQTNSTNFPVRNAFQANFGGGGADCFLSKVSSVGSLLWSTNFGGSGSESCYAAAVDGTGNVFIAGESNSFDLPLKNASQTFFTQRNGFTTPFVARFTTNGGLLTSSYLGGPVAGSARSVAIDAAGAVYIGGVADGRLTTKNAFQAQSAGGRNGFVLKVDGELRNIAFSTYLGGSNDDGVLGIAVDQSGNSYMTGWASSPDFPTKNSLYPFRAGGAPIPEDLFVTKLSSSGSALIYSTFFGSGGAAGTGIAVDPQGSAYVIGTTGSPSFPTKNAFQSGPGGNYDFVFAKISDGTPLAPSPLTPNPGRLLFRYTQNGTAPAPQGVMVFGATFTATTSAPWLTANTSGSNVTVSVNPVGLAPNTYNASVILNSQAATPASIDVTLTVLAPAPVLVSLDPALIPMGSNDTTITIHGSSFTSTSTLQVNSLPWTVTPVQFVDASTLKFSMPRSYFSVQYNHTVVVQNPQSALSNVLSVAVGQPAPQFTAASVANAASYAVGPLAPGEIIIVFGSNFGLQADTQVSFDNVPATLIYVTSTQLGATVPYSIAGAVNTTMVINFKGVASVPVTLAVTDSAPAIFTADASGKGQAAALNQDQTVNGISNPASVGSVVALYGTGGGALTTDSLPRLSSPVSATVGGIPAQVYYAGVAPGLVQGVMQINVQIPDGVTPAPAIPVIVTVGNASSTAITVAVQ